MWEDIAPLTPQGGMIKMKHGKKYIDSKKLIDATKLYDPAEAIELQ